MGSFLVNSNISVLSQKTYHQGFCAKPAYSNLEISYYIDILHVTRLAVILVRERIIEAKIRQGRCARCSVPLFLAGNIARFSREHPFS